MKEPIRHEPDPNASESSSSSSLTRREMLVTIGSAAILYGLPAVAPSEAVEAQSTTASLPPGLYQPSLDHLTHALSSESPFPSIPAGTQTEYIARPSTPFAPQAFSSGDFAVVRRLVQIILGDNLKTSTAIPDITAGVAEWIDLVVASAPNVRAAAQNLSPELRALAVAYFGAEAPVKQLENFAPEEICRDGLVWLAAESRGRTGKPFLEAEQDAQIALVREISDSRPDPSAENPGTRLFAFLKEESIRGFYTSQQGLKELDFKGNAFYAQSPGCSLDQKS
jgi:hypothetical protein